MMSIAHLRPVPALRTVQNYKGWDPGLESRKHRSRNDVLPNTANPWRVLGGECLPFLRGSIVGDPEVHHLVLDDDIFWPRVHPLSSFQLTHQLGPNARRARRGGRDGLASGWGKQRDGRPREIAFPRRY
jgi:hypothetical protein